MGQYYITVNLDKKQYLHPHKFNEGLKLMEFGCSANGTLTALAILLSSGNGRGGGDLRAESDLIGSWAGDRVVVTGDYADPLAHVTDEQAEAWREANPPEGDPTLDPTLYDVARDQFEDISEQILAVICEDTYVAEQHSSANTFTG